MEAFPDFPYHPDPVGTGSVEPSDAVCRCCGRARGFIYVGPAYGEDDLDDCLCPWCIESGKAASSFDATFVDDTALVSAGLEQSVIDQVSLRTPGYNSLQPEEWLSHCGDACAYHGEASKKDVGQAAPSTIEAWERNYGLTSSDWNGLAERYVPGGDVAFYKFQCRHCEQVLLGWDCT